MDLKNGVYTTTVDLNWVQWMSTAHAALFPGPTFMFAFVYRACSWSVKFQWNYNSGRMPSFFHFQSAHGLVEVFELRWQNSYT